jgi:hypothetical protein
MDKGDDEEYYNEVKDEDDDKGEGSDSEEDEGMEDENANASEVLAALMEDDSGGEDGGYQPTNPLHYIRMIRQILTGYVQQSIK